MATRDGRQSAPGYAEFARQHASLQHDIARLTDAVTTAIAPRASDQVSLFDQFDRLQGRLQRHFQAEEADGYLEYVRKKRPGLASFADRLKDQHAEILSALGALRCDGAESSFGDAKANLMYVLDLLRRHEVEEFELIQRALSEDIGSGD